MRAHVDAHLGGSLAGRVPSAWFQERGLQECLVCGLTVSTRFGIHPTCRPDARSVGSGRGRGSGAATDGDGALPSFAEIQGSPTPTLRPCQACLGAGLHSGFGCGGGVQ